MNWTRTENPLVWEASDGIHHAMAEESSYGEGGFIARVYVKPLQLPLLGDREAERISGTARWGLDAEAALRQSIKRFDGGAVLPPRKDGLYQLALKEKEVSRETTSI